MQETPRSNILASNWFAAVGFIMVVLIPPVGLTLSVVALYQQKKQLGVVKLLSLVGVVAGIAIALMIAAYALLFVFISGAHLTF